MGGLVGLRWWVRRWISIIGGCVGGYVAIDEKMNRWKCVGK